MCLRTWFSTPQCVPKHTCHFLCIVTFKKQNNIIPKSMASHICNIFVFKLDPTKPKSPNQRCQNIYLLWSLHYPIVKGKNLHRWLCWLVLDCWMWLQVTSESFPLFRYFFSVTPYYFYCNVVFIQWCGTLLFCCVWIVYCVSFKVAEYCKPRTRVAHNINEMLISNPNEWRNWMVVFRVNNSFTIQQQLYMKKEIEWY